MSEIDYRKEAVVLKKQNFKGEMTAESIEDLIKYEELKRCSLYHFYITETDIKNLNKLEKLNYIYFDFCYFKLENIKLKPTIKTLCFNLCENLQLRLLKNSNVENIKIVQLKESNIIVDIAEMEKMDSLKELSIHNCYIKRIDKILEIAPNLKYLNFDGSVIENPEYLAQLEGKIQVSRQEKFYLANA